MNNIARILVGSVLLLSCGCACMSNSEKGFLGGGALGAGAGALIGLACHNPAAGAIIGGVAGAAAGGIAGGVADREKARGYAQGIRDQQAMQMAQVSARQINMYDVIRMTQQHVNDQLIIQEIRSTYSNFNLSPSDVITLKQNGVSDAVVVEMQRAHYVPVYGPQPVYGEYIYEPAPVVGVGFGYYGRGRW
jgi:hypothetical protein